MADNSLRTPGVGESIASDDIAGVKHQRVKIGVGADGAAVDVQPPDADAKASSSIVSAGPMLYNSATLDRARSVQGAGGDGGVGLGVQAVGLMLVDRAGGVFERAGSVEAADARPETGLFATHNLLYNGATFDRERGNLEGTLLASAARTVLTDSPSQTNYNARGVIIWLSITVASGTGGLSVQVLATPPVGANTVILTNTSTAIIATGTYGYEIYPGSASAGTAGSRQVNVRTQAVLPRTWIARVNVGDASSYTYSLGYSYIL